MLRRPFLWTVDTFILQRGTENQAHCLARDHLVGCRDLFQHHLVGMDWFPVFQHLPDATMHAVGLSPSARLHGLDAISVAAFLATVAWGTLALRRAGHARLAMLFTLTIVAGPMLVYGHSSFGEMLAALLILAWQLPPSVRSGPGRSERWPRGVADQETAPAVVFRAGRVGPRHRPHPAPRRHQAGRAAAAPGRPGLLVSMLYKCSASAT